MEFIKRSARLVISTGLLQSKMAKLGRFIKRQTKSLYIYINGYSFSHFYGVHFFWGWGGRGGGGTMECIKRFENWL